MLCFLANGSAQAASRAHVYLMRGLFNVSVGLDALAGKLEGMGIPASVYGDGDGDTVAGEAIREYRSGRVHAIILIGHSLGAGAVVDVARDLNKAGVPVALLIALDPVFPTVLAPNVRRAVDYYVSGSGLPLGVGPDFRGHLLNMDVGGEPGMNHMAVQASEAMHARMITQVRAAVAGGEPAGRGKARRHRRRAAWRRQSAAWPQRDWSLVLARPI